MITGSLKSKIDKLWEEFWTGGITNPLTVIEQITFLMYARLLDMNETTDEKKAARTKKPFKRRFNEKQQHLRWQSLKNIESAEKLFNTIRDELFPYFKSTANGDSLFAEFMKDAQLMIQKPTLLMKAFSMIDKLPLEKSDVKGDLYEYLLSKLTTAGINGQFRTPRHIIRAIVEMMDPIATDRICDPACGTAGFLATAYEFILEKYSSPEGTIEEVLLDTEGHPQLGDKGKPLTQKIYTGDLLAEHRKHVDTDMFHGFDFDATMLRIAAMNLVMHGVAEPDIHYQDTLSQRFTENYPHAANEGFDLILANPPFKGSLDEEDVAPELLRVVKTKKTELLFVALILRMLNEGSRGAVIVPISVLEGESSAHQQLRAELLNNQVEAVISLPHWVFKPYASVATAILVFTKGGRSEKIWYYKLENDGFSDGANKTPIPGSEMAKMVRLFKQRHKKTYVEVRNKHRFVSFQEIQENDSDMCPNIYLRDYEYPKRFPLKRLDEIFYITKGGYGAAEAVDCGKYPLVTSSSEFKSCNQYSFKGKAICIPLVSSTGHGHASINNIHFVDGKFEAASIMAVLSLRSDIKDECVIEYVYSYLLTHKDDVLVPYMKGSANVSLNPSRLGRIKIPYPSELIRKDMAKQIFETQEKIKVIQDQLTHERKKLESAKLKVRGAI